MPHNFGDKLESIKQNCSRGKITCIFLLNEPIDLVGLCILHAKIISGKIKKIFWDWDRTISYKHGIRGPDELSEERSLYSKDYISIGRKKYTLSDMNDAQTVMNDLLTMYNDYGSYSELMFQFFGDSNRQLLLRYIFNSKGIKNYIISSNSVMEVFQIIYRTFLVYLGVTIENANSTICRYSPWRQVESDSDMRTSNKLQIINNYINTD